MKRRLFLRSSLGLGLILSGLAWLPMAPCAPQQVPAPLPGVTRDVAYGTDAAQKMDVFPPVGFAGPRPGVILIHGGGWQGGDKGFYGPLGQALAAKGFVAFSINYRLTPAAHYPAQTDDAQNAVRWVRAHAGRFHLDPQRMGALGDSAGGHLAVVLGTRDLEAAPARSSHVQCVVDFYGPTDLTVVAPAGPLSDVQKYALGVMKDFLGGTREQNPAAYRAASPLFDVSARSAPTLIIQGMDDTLVPPDQSERLADALRAAGVEAVLALMYKQGHGFLNPGAPGTYGGMAAEWLTRHLKP